MQEFNICQVGRLVRYVLGTLCLLLLVSLMCLPAFGQSDKGSITGTVTDTSGATVPGAEVRLAPVGASVVTDMQGAFRLPEVPPGKYTVTVSYVGFAPLVSDVEVTAGQRLALDLKLKTASASEEVLVTAERPHGEGEAINETRSTDNILQVLPQEVITSLPNANVAERRRTLAVCVALSD
jgi:hypothetical protein